MEEWNIFFTSLGLSNEDVATYSQKFLDQGCTELSLYGLDVATLRTDLSITKVGHISAILDYVSPVSSPRTVSSLLPKSSLTPPKLNRDMS